MSEFLVYLCVASGSSTSTNLLQSIVKGMESLPFLDMGNSSKILTLCIFTHGEDHDGYIGKTQIILGFVPGNQNDFTLHG